MVSKLILLLAMGECDYRVREAAIACRKKVLVLVVIATQPLWTD